MSAKWDHQLARTVERAGPTPVRKFGQAFDRFLEGGLDTLGCPRTHWRDEEWQSLEISQGLRQKPDLVPQRGLSR